MAILLDMTRVHVPVLAGELIELTAPAPGETVVDCTFGAGGHARLIADRIGPSGTLVCIDRDPLAEEHFDELAREVACETRFLRMDYADGPRAAARGGPARRRRLPRPRDLLDAGGRARARLLLLLRRAARHAHGPGPGARRARDREHAGTSARLAQLFRRLGEDPNAGRIAREIVRRRERAPIETTGELVAAIEAALPAAVRRSFGGGSPAKRVFQAIRIAVNSELDSLDRALPLAWELLREGGRLAAISFHSLEDRRVKRFLAERARGCVCPPDFPVCVCGREPEAELITGPRRGADAGRGRRQPAREVGPPALGAQAPRGGAPA